MWHEARKHEKKLRGMMVDYKRRAERRREFYEKIRRDPSQFLQIHGQKAKIHLDASISQAAESSLMPWRGDNMNMIDRFDVRAHLDFIDTHTAQESEADPESNIENEGERRVNYERWRNLVQNEYLGVSETKILHQIWLEERFGMNQTPSHDSQNVLKKKLAEKKAAIAYNYDKEEETSFTALAKKSTESGSSSEESESEDDYDTAVNIDALTIDQGIRINSLSHKYGLKGNDFLRFLEEDKVEAERIRLAKEIENEKSMFSGRKSRRERRALKERRMLILRANNAEETSKSIEIKKVESTSSESEISEVEVDEAKIEFITSFGGSSDDEKDLKSNKPTKQIKNASRKKKSEQKSSRNVVKASPVIFGPSLPPEAQEMAEKTNFNTTSSRSRSYRYKKSRSRSRSPKVSRRNGSVTRVRNSRHRSLSSNRSRSRSKGRNRSRSRCRSRSRSRSRGSRRNRERNRSRSLSRNRLRNRNRDRDRERDRERYRRRRSRSVSKSRMRYRSRSRNRRQRSRSSSRSRISRKRGRSSSVKRFSRSKRSRSSSSRSRSVSSKCQENKVLKDEVEKDENILQQADVEITPLPKQELACVDLVADSQVTVAMSSTLPSPPVKRYYRYDLAKKSESESEPEENISNFELAKHVEKYD
ncbi:splicing factor: arginine/serine-rich-like protein [Leptotrombidium deliense]|uniref:Splicing factor: arginine/serine-rich-like protein n=1 Tax=Leptotrombidium deliense TaxID=299467 RepID=A0A443SH36_9ACAR|nr:splicing factor: arginine/serine-rich-like protein [Leptotrombidium deliense]